MIFLKKIKSDCTQIKLRNCGANICGKTSKICDFQGMDLFEKAFLRFGSLFQDEYEFDMSNIFYKLVKLRDFYLDGFILPLIGNNLNLFKDLIKNVGKTFLNEGFNNVKNWLGNIKFLKNINRLKGKKNLGGINTDQFINAMLKQVKKYILRLDYLADIYSENAILKKCRFIRDLFSSRILSSLQPKDSLKDFVLQDLRILMESCDKENNNFECKNLMDRFAPNWDPTWIVSIASLFRQDDCPAFK